MGIIRLARAVKEQTMEEAAMDRLLDSRSTAAYLGVHPMTLSKWRAEHEGPTHLKIGKAVRYRLSDLVAWLETCARKGA